MENDQFIFAHTLLTFILLSTIRVRAHWECLLINMNNKYTPYTSAKLIFAQCDFEQQKRKKKSINEGEI
jgi:hypothetical protein